MKKVLLNLFLCAIRDTFPTENALRTVNSLNSEIYIAERFSDSVPKAAFNRMADNLVNVLCSESKSENEVRFILGQISVLKWLADIDKESILEVVNKLPIGERKH